nr:TPA_asm: hexon [Corynactis coral adintovirus]
MSFRNPKYVERFEDVVFDLETALNVNVVNGARQKKDGYRFVVDNSGEVTPFDWYNARISMDFKVNLTADGANITLNDHNGIVNGSFAFVKDLDIKVNGKKLYDCNDANHCVNVKNLLEYSPTYAKSTATNEFFYLDTSRSAEERPVQAAYNKGFATRKLLLGLSRTVNTEIPLNRYSFFESLEDELLPNTRIELNFEIESDSNLIWQAGADCRVIITRMQLFVPRITLNSEGQSLYMSQYLKPRKWTYLRENVERSNSSTQRVGNFKITSGISKPRHVFVFIINDANVESQTVNPFLYNTFSVSTDPRTLLNCHLEVGNGNEYPEIHYTPNADITRVYRDVLRYSHGNNDYQGGTLLNRSNYKSIFPFLYFDLTKQKMDIKDGTTKISFRYELSGTTATPYGVYALTLHEHEVELLQKDGKLLLR